LGVGFGFVLKRSALVQSENRMKKKIFFLCFPFFAKKKRRFGLLGAFYGGKRGVLLPQKSLSLSPRRGGERLDQNEMKRSTRRSLRNNHLASPSSSFKHTHIYIN